ncbi:hypothetical protein [Hymenobacter negativus]|uniref:Uncharacterized protein n=1 Tax=Hymenobacter negativus TaxID=2795026 RepID=A0ABS3QDQ8_9BACT|nr:hypothetical protein [Hymenobacter negativus]MBO2009380.1 hypothetical protein [Hymenobacter negativus]
MAATLSHAQSPAFRLDLKAEKLSVPAGPWQVTRVLDLRADRSRLGTVHKGMNNEVVSANFNQPLAPELLQFLKAQLPASPGARPVTMRIFTLVLNEELRASAEHSEAELVADFLEPQPDSTYRVLLTVGETTQRGGLDVTKHHAANIALLLQQAMLKLEALPATAAATETMSGADALAGRGGAMAQRFPIQKAAELKRGLYRSFQEFRDNNPSEPEYPFAVQHIARTGKRWAGTDEVQVNYLNTDDAHPTRPMNTSKLWGLCDGNELLIIYRNRFYKLLAAADGRSYTFLGPPVFDEKAAANMAGAAAVGGLLGAAIAGAANSAGAPDVYELHLASGRVVPVEQAGQTDADGFVIGPDTAKVYVYRRNDPAKDQTVAISGANQPAQPLRTWQWTLITWTDRRKELKVCAQFGNAPATCREFVPDFSQPTYLECVVPAGGGAPELKPVLAKEGQFEMKRIQRLAKANK